MNEFKDHYADLREQITAAMIDCSERIQESYRARIDEAARLGNYERLALLRADLLLDLNFSERPFVKLAASLPPPPMIVRTWYDEKTGGMRVEPIAPEDFYEPAEKRDPSNI